MLWWQACGMGVDGWCWCPFFLARARPPNPITGVGATALATLCALHGAAAAPESSLRPARHETSEIFVTIQWSRMTGQIARNQSLGADAKHTARPLLPDAAPSLSTCAALRAGALHQQLAMPRGRSLQRTHRSSLPLHMKTRRITNTSLAIALSPLPSDMER